MGSIVAETYVLAEVMLFTVGALVMITAELVLKDTVTIVPDVMDTGTTVGTVVKMTD